jgi:hypothetical protein
LCCKNENQIFIEGPPSAPPSPPFYRHQIYKGHEGETQSVIATSEVINKNIKRKKRRKDNPTSPLVPLFI